MRHDVAGVVNEHYDHAFVLDTLLRLARAPTDVPLGQNEIDPTDPKIGRYVRDVVRPIIESLDLGPAEVDDWNNLVVRFGQAPVPSLLVMTYTTAQHGNYTDPSLEGQLTSAKEYGYDGECVFGKGTSQNKGALAATLGALKILRRSRGPLKGGVTLVVNAESQSSHRCSMRIIGERGIRAEAGWLAIGSPKIVIGHRGRIDVHVTVKGEAGHSSQPELARNAIWGLSEALARLSKLRGRLTLVDPDLGREQLEPYKLVTAPIAPHTMPAEAHLVIDRRLLPGTEPDRAVDEIREALGEIPGYDVIVRGGAYHMPYRVSPALPHVQALAQGFESFRGRRPEIGYVPYAFDAGFANHRGIPTVMFGPSSDIQRTAGSKVLEPEFVPVAEVQDFTKIYAHAMLSLLGA